VKIQICIPLPIRKASDLTALLRKAEAEGADFIEIRLDYLENTDQIEETFKVLRGVSVPIIATNRKYEEGGYRPQDEGQRIQTLIRAAKEGFQYVDIELKTANLQSIIPKLRDLGAKPIISFHDFNLTPTISEMKKIMEAEIKLGAEVCKMVTTAKEVSDNILCLFLTEQMGKIAKVVCFAMGKKGILSRTLSPLFGAYFTYASLEAGLETASGQISLSDLKALYERLGVGG